MKTKGWSKKDEEKLYWFLVTAYIADAMGILDMAKKLKLTNLSAQYGGELTWQQHVEVQIGLSPAFIRAVTELCLGEMGGRKERPWPLLFFQRGLGCPDPVKRIKDVLG